MNDKESEIKPYEIDREAIYLHIEDEEGESFDTYSYLGLRQLKFNGIDEKQQNFLMFFDQITIEVNGENLLDLYKKIAQHSVSLIRKGKTFESDLPSISRIRVIENEKKIKEK